MIKDSGKYLIIKIVSALIPLILLPILSRYLSESGFGIYSLFRTLILFLFPLIGFSIPNVILKRFYTLSKNDLSSYISSSIIFSIALLCIAISILLIFGSTISDILNIDIYYLFLAIVTAFSMSTIGIFLNIFRAEKKINLYFYFTLLLPLLFVILVLVLISMDHASVENIVMAYTLSSMVALSIIGIFFYRFGYTYFKIDIHKMIDMFKYSYPLVLSGFFALIYSSADRFLINKYLSADELGIYSATMQLAMVIVIVGSAIQLAWTPVVFERLEENFIENLPRVIKYIFLLGCLLVSIVVIYYFIFPYIFHIILPSNYIQGLDFAIYLIIGGLFQSMYWLINPILLFLEKNIFFIYISATSALFSLTANFILIKNGLTYVAVIFAITWILQFILLSVATVYSVQKKRRQYE